MDVDFFWHRNLWLIAADERLDEAAARRGRNVRKGFIVSRGSD